MRAKIQCLLKLIFVVTVVIILGTEIMFVEFEANSHKKFIGRYKDIRPRIAESEMILKHRKTQWEKSNTDTSLTYERYKTLQENDQKPKIVKEIREKSLNDSKESTIMDAFLQPKLNEQEKAVLMDLLKVFATK